MLLSLRTISLPFRATLAASVLSFGFGLIVAGDTAEAAHAGLHRHRHHRTVHLVRAPVRAYVPGGRYDNLGVDDDPSTDGIGIGREGPVPGPNNFPGIAAVSSYPAPGYEIEGPPISPSLPNLPVLTPELIH